ncbi:MAG: DUF1697 domain-containing protein [Chloroflexi bacterium]|nr:DUF1697 domain-containing protein [Chloroflexota bacterium]MCY3958559.1 DUF1697 domain-containing protein [Chloroflexota bacterium]
MQDRDQADAIAADRPYVALLRGINVGGRNKLPMRELAAMFMSVGCKGVRTYIQSGNVVFRASQELADRLPALVSAEIAASRGFQIPVILRTASEFSRIVRDNRFLAAGPDPTKLHVGFLADTPDPAHVARLDPDRSPPDVFEVQGREVYLHFPAGVARSKLDNAYFDRTLHTVCTIRNWRTVCRLNEMVGDA